MGLAEDRNYDFGEYVRQGEPDQIERADAWRTAIGLQAVDGLTPSGYLVETARKHIEGSIGIDEAHGRLRSYYEEKMSREEVDAGEMEADLVSARIAKILSEKAFTFSPVQLRTIHGTLFEGLLRHAGSYRQYNITKHEWVLGGDTVYYASFNSIEDTLRYDFERESEFEYGSVDAVAAVRRIAAFVSGIWQVHPFPEGNTRTVAVFAIKYLNSMGYSVDNEQFERHSWYFRNALVRANYSNHAAGVSSTKRYLDMFFDNLLLGGEHELRNRYLHVNYEGESSAPSMKRGVERLLDALGDEELATRELMARLELSDRSNFVNGYLKPALEGGFIERTIPDKPTSKLQRYRKARKITSSGVSDCLETERL